MELIWNLAGIMLNNLEHSRQRLTFIRIVKTQPYISKLTDNIFLIKGGKKYLDNWES